MSGSGTHKGNPVVFFTIFARMKKTFFIAALFFVFLGLESWGLPVIPNPPEVKEGTFPNGLHYFIVSNPAEEGFADYAIVQPGMDGRVDRMRFLEGKGVGYGPEGITSQKAGARIINYRNVPVSVQHEQDSTLLLLLDYVWQSPFNQTVIIAGDVDITKTERALEVMNLTIPRLQECPYDIPASQSGAELVCEPAGDVVTIGVRYELALAQAELRPTAVHFVTELMMRQFSTIVADRVRDVFRSMDIPCSRLETQYIESQGDGGVDCGSVTFIVSDKDRKRAQEALRDILHDIEERGVTAVEFDNSRTVTVPVVARNGLRKGESNAKYVQRCVASTVFGLPLCSTKDIRNFFIGKQVDWRRAHSIFNDFARSLLCAEELEPVEPIRDSALVNDVSTHLPVKRIKLNSETVDPVSGGKVWTFDNGIKVVYKNLEDIRGRVSYAFSFRGGLTIVPGIRYGEAPYVADMFDLSTVRRDVPMTEFKSILARRGITMSQEVTMSDFRISGTAPATGLETLLGAVGSIAYHRTPNPDMFDYYCLCESVRTMSLKDPQADVLAAMDDLCCPEDMYRTRRDASFIGDDLQTRTEQYFRDRFSNFADGTIVIAGDIGEEELKKILENNLGLFRTGRKYSYRKTDNFPLVPERMTLREKGEPSVHMLFVADEFLTTAGIAKLDVTEKVLIPCLNAALRGIGAYAEAKVEFTVYSDERIRLYITAKPLEEASLPEGIVPASPETIASTIRAMIDYMDSIDPRRLSDAKMTVLGDVGVENARGRNIVDKVLLRYSEGKDFSKDFAAAVKAVGQQDVLSTLEKFRSGARVEFIFDR